MACGLHISEATCRPYIRLGLCYISRDFLVWPKLGDLCLHCWVHISQHIPTWASASFITWRRRTTKKTSFTAVGVIFIAPVIARQAAVCNWALCCWPLATKLLSRWSIWVWSQWYTSNAPSWVSEPRFYQMCFTGPKIPVRFFHHICQLCLPCQSLVQKKSKVFDLWSQLQCLSTGSWFFQAP